MSTKMCENCESWLLLVNGQWSHQHTIDAYACFEKQAVEAGTPAGDSQGNDPNLGPDLPLEDETMKYLLEILA